MDELTKEDRARITDSTHKIQSVSESLEHVDPRKIPGLNEIKECLENSDRTLRQLLRSFGPRVRKPGEAT